MDEIWLDVVGYEGEYMVSSLGRMKSLDRMASYRRHHSGGTKLVKGKILPCTTTKRGYNQTVLSRNGSSKTVRVCRIVAEAFYGTPAEGMQCCHANGISTDDRAENLRWGTAKDNSNDRDRHGTTPSGEVHRNSKYKSDLVGAIIRGEVSQMEALKVHGMPNGTFTWIRCGFGWKNHPARVS